MKEHNTLQYSSLSIHILYTNMPAAVCSYVKKKTYLQVIYVYESGKRPTCRTISSIICLFESSTCFEQLCAHPKKDNCINTTSGIITLKYLE